MRMMVFFDLPVSTRQNQRNAAIFRKFLLKDGYHMVQFSIYARTCNGYDAVEKHRIRLRSNLPPHGSIRLMIVTEKQYQAIEILVGSMLKEDAPVSYEQLSIF